MTWEEAKLKAEEILKDQMPWSKGWHRILTDGFQIMLANGWRGEVFDLKEKFGTLRVYLEDVPLCVQDLPACMEFASKFLCEWCGEAGRLRGEDLHWWRTLCDSCHDKAKTGWHP